jgi:hypothetical protein
MIPTESRHRSQDVQGIGAALPVAPSRTRYDWLLDPRNRRSNLRLLETAIRRGDLTPSNADVDVLLEVLAQLLTDPTTPVRQRLRILRIVVTMDGLDVGTVKVRRNETGRPGRESGPARHRPPSCGRQ